MSFFDSTLQSIELSDWIELTASRDSPDLVILAGDFNSKPNDLPVQILESCCHLKMSQENRETVTWNAEGNCFRDHTQDSQTLDYIFYRHSGLMFEFGAVTL